MAMQKVGIRFRFRGIAYEGTLEPVMGSGSTSNYHLMVNNYYWGRLRMANDKWVFDPTPKSQGMEVLADWMRKKVESIV